MKTLARVACTLTLVASSLAAQQRPRGTVFADGAIVRFGEVSGTPAGSFSGPTFGVEGGVSLGSLRLGAGYLEGRVQPSTGSSDSVAKDLVEARAFVGAQPWPWLRLTVGPHVRAFVWTNGVTERWVLWPLRARAQTALASTPLETYVELWRALSAKVNLPEAVDHVQGGEAGVVLRPRGSALWMRLGYRVDGAQLGGGSRSESVEAVSFAVGIGPR